jgi:hypothetical protein
VVGACISRDSRWACSLCTVHVALKLTFNFSMQSSHEDIQTKLKVFDRTILFENIGWDSTLIFYGVFWNIKFIKYHYF